MDTVEPNTTPHVLVTGANGGIGAACCELLSQRGYRVTRWDLPQHDVTDATQVRADFTALEESAGPVDALVHTSGVMQPDHALPTADTASQTATDTPHALDHNFAVNFRGVVNVCSIVARSMVQRGHGAIVVVSSNAGATPRAGMASYGASKAAATSWVRTLGLECAPHGVRCNIVSPGSTRTPMLEGMWEPGTDQSSTVIAGTPEQYRLGIPLQRIAQPADVAAACEFLLSPAARHITMHDLRVDGGATLDQ